MAREFRITGLDADGEFRLRAIPRYKCEMCNLERSMSLEEYASHVDQVHSEMSPRK